ncbi:uncharacterized protein LOC124364994 [Homalodisca vitripennis]|uniref:uncharacterized protein LOC124364994 n=1 Tax=Homalodisca vitripennis TaxID=197043 RepID=UPI001EEA1040|nr:uncharacterized protein LOC124364994 [Homalodisca vitripennis]
MGEGLSPSPVRRVAEPLRQTTAENSLIEPTEVLVCQSPVLTAEPVLTPLEKLRRTDEVIREALEEKKRLVADILRVCHVMTTTTSQSWQLSLVGTRKLLRSC